MNLSGLLVGLATFLIIGLFHPIVIKSEYHFGVRCWWVFLLVGIGFAIGLVVGLVVHAVAADAAWVEQLITWVTTPLSTIFLNLIFMLIVPLMFSALVMGVAEMGDVRALGRIGWRTLGYTVLLTSTASSR